MQGYELPTPQPPSSILNIRKQRFENMASLGQSVISERARGFEPMGFEYTFHNLTPLQTHNLKEHSGNEAFLHFCSLLSSVGSLVKDSQGVVEKAGPLQMP